MGQQTNRAKKGWGRERTEQQFPSLSLSMYSKLFFIYLFIYFFFNNSKPFDDTVSFLFYTKRLLNCVTPLLNSKLFRFLIGNVAES